MAESFLDSDGSMLIIQGIERLKVLARAPKHDLAVLVFLGWDVTKLFKA
jgi:hypothetical protein